MKGLFQTRVTITTPTVSNTKIHKFVVYVFVIISEILKYNYYYFVDTVTESDQFSGSENNSFSEIA